MKNKSLMQAIPFFNQTEWERARIYMQDGAEFRATYAEFLERVEQFERTMNQRGHTTARIAIEQTAFTHWCAVNQCQINAAARAQYAATLALKFETN